MNRNDLALHLLHHLAWAHKRGRRHNLQELVSLVQVRRVDVRATLTLLHRQGLYDALRYRLTLTGFAIGLAQRAAELPELRPAKQVAVKAA
jgi:hypothetical protein